MPEQISHGIIETFSFRKGVIRISGKWLWFCPAVVRYMRGISWGDEVDYIEKDRLLKWIRKTDTKQSLLFRRDYDGSEPYI